LQALIAEVIIQISVSVARLVFLHSYLSVAVNYWLCKTAPGIPLVPSRDLAPSHQLHHSTSTTELPIKSWVLSDPPDPNTRSAQ
jgi:hypothetical protein